MRSTSFVCLGLAGSIQLFPLATFADGLGSGSGSWIGYIGGGNQATGQNSAAVAGANNLAGAQGAFVGAGTANQATGLSALVLGGFDNRATYVDALVGAGAGNRASGARSIVVGGGYNAASGHFSFIGGGGRDGVETIAAGTHDRDNVASRKWTVVVGGVGNEASTDGATVVGGGFNTASGMGSFVGGGGICCDNDEANPRPNVASGTGSVVTGGHENVAAGFASTVGGGSRNSASDVAAYATVSGGVLNGASGLGATVAGGGANTASGQYATVAGGSNNDASGNSSFAAGNRARATTNGTFMWADSQNFDFQPSVANFFGARATGGVGFTVAINGAGAPVQYCNLLPGVASWQCTSDRNAKENFVAADGRDILQRLAAMPLFYWNFKGADPATRMLGPTAQDFREAFGLGNDDKTIASVNLDGVALGAIQGLNARLEAGLAERDATIAVQARELAAQRTEIAELRRAVDALLALAPRDHRLVTGAFTPSLPGR